jgi:tellurite resistance protein
MKNSPVNKPTRLALNLPVGYFGIVLGLIGLGFAWQDALWFSPFSHKVGDSIIILAILIWVPLTLSYLYRLFFYPKSVLTELYDPIVSSEVSLFPATIMQVSLALLPLSCLAATTVFGVGLALHIAYTVWHTSKLWSGAYSADATTPVLYLPAVANNFIAATICGALGYHNTGILLMGSGLFSWLSLEPAILQHLRRSGGLPLSQRTTLGVQLAPALVACAAWLSINGGDCDLFAKMLFGYGLLLLLFILKLMPWYLPQAFNVSFWSFSFGIAALASTGMHLGRSAASGLFHALALPLFIFANIAIFYLLLRTLIGMLKGQFFIWADADVLRRTGK